MSLRITDDPAADELLSSNPLALLIGMLRPELVSRPLTATAGSGRSFAATVLL